MKYAPKMAANGRQPPERHGWHDEHKDHDGDNHDQAPQDGPGAALGAGPLS